MAQLLTIPHQPDTTTKALSNLVVMKKSLEIRREETKLAFNRINDLQIEIHIAMGVIRNNMQFADQALICLDELQVRLGRELR